MYKCIHSFWQAHSVAESLEFELFRQHRQLMSNGYRRAARRLVFSLRQNESLRRDIFENKDSVSRIVTELQCGRQSSVIDDVAHGSQASTSESVDNSGH